MRTAAKVNFLSSVFQSDGRFWRFFRQAGRAYDQILRFFKTLFRINNKDINATLATEKIFLAIMSINGCPVFADSKPDQRTATCRADKRFQYLPPI